MPNFGTVSRDALWGHLSARRGLLDILLNSSEKSSVVHVPGFEPGTSRV